MQLRLGAIPKDQAVRSLAMSTLINTIGNGLFMTVDVIYFTTIIGLTPGHVAIGLTIAGGIGVLANIPAGQLSDRFSPRELAVWATCLQGLLIALFIFVHSFAFFLLLNIFAAVLDGFSRATRMTIISRIGGAENRLMIRAYTRTITNLGIAIGTVCAGFALAHNTKFGYQCLLIGDALTYFGCAYFLHRLPYIEPTVTSKEPISFLALKDARYLTATFLNAVMALHFILQTVAIPLWVVRETHAPRWWVSVIMLVNTVGVIAFQMRASKSGDDLISGTRLFRNATVAIALACVLYSLSKGVNAVAACILLLLAMGIHVFGEVIGSIGSWSIGFGLAQEKHQGQYQGVYSLGIGLSDTFGPSIVIYFAITLGRVGWFCLAGIFLTVGIAMSALVRSTASAAERSK